MLKTGSYIGIFTYYLVPVCFLIGLLANLTGSICILAKYKMRKRTPLFIIAIIGLSDIFTLGTQLQRWLAVNFDQYIFLNSSGICKLYFMIFRSSSLISISLLFCLIMTRFIRFYFGLYHLSTYSNLGQICSKLCVVYIFALGLSLSWNPLWSSGIKIGDEPVYDPNYKSTINFSLDEESSEQTTTFASTTNSSSVSALLASKRIIDLYELDLNRENVKCFKNVDSLQIVDILNLLYFMVGFILNLMLVFISVLIWLKVKNIKIFNLLCVYATDLVNKNNSDNSINVNYDNDFNLNSSVRRTSENFNSSIRRSSFPNVKSTNTKRNSDCAIENPSRIAPSLSATSIEMMIKNNWRKTEVEFLDLSSIIPSKPRKFSWYLITICITSSLFSLPFFIFDYAYYEHAGLDKHSLNFMVYNQSLDRINELCNGTLSQNFSSQIKKEEAIIYKFFMDSLINLPGFLMIIPHTFKFYILFIFYSRFRRELSKFLRLRFYININLFKQVGLIKSRKLISQSRTKSDQPSSVAEFKPAAATDSNPENIEMVVSFKNSDNSIKMAKSSAEKSMELKHKFNIVCCLNEDKVKSDLRGSDSMINELTITQIQESNRIKRKKKNRFNNNKSSVYRMMAKYEKDDDETSSIVGFNLSNKNIEFNKPRGSLYGQTQNS